MITFGYNNLFSSVLRALSAIGVGCVMLFGNDATVTVVKIIAAFLLAAGLVSFAYGYLKRKDGIMSLMSVNSIVDIIIGLLLFFFPTQVAGFIVSVIGIVLVILGVIQLATLGSVSRNQGSGYASLLLPTIAIIGGISLLFTPFGKEIMRTIAGAALVVYGASELLTAHRVSKAVRPKNPSPQAETTAETEKTGITVDELAVKDVEYQKIEE